MRFICPNCSHLVIQDRNPDGLNYCPSCRQLFLMPLRKVPAWVLGVLVILMAYWLIVAHLRAAL